MQHQTLLYSVLQTPLNVSLVKLHTGAAHTAGLNVFDQNNKYLLWLQILYRKQLCRNGYSSCSSFTSRLDHRMGGTTAPDGWLLCQGQAISRTTYAALFAVTGTEFGTGNGSSTFNIPDIRGRT